MKTTEIVQTALITATIIILGMIPPLPLGFIPVPIVMQNLGIMLAAVILGPKKGTLAILGFLLLALIGFQCSVVVRQGLHFCRTNWRLFARVVINATHDRLWSFPAIY